MSSYYDEEEFTIGAANEKLFGNEYLESLSDVYGGYRDDDYSSLLTDDFDIIYADLKAVGGEYEKHSPNSDELGDDNSDELGDNFYNQSPKTKTELTELLSVFDHIPDVTGGDIEENSNTFW